MLISVEVLLPSFNNSQYNLVTEKQILYLLQQGTSGVEFVLFSIRKGFSANSPLCARGLSRAPTSLRFPGQLFQFSEWDHSSAGTARGGEVEILPIQYIIVRERNGAYPGKRVYRAGLKSGPQVAKSLEASGDRSNKQQQEQNSPNLGPTF